LLTNNRYNMDDTRGVRGAKILHDIKGDDDCMMTRTIFLYIHYFRNRLHIYALLSALRKDDLLLIDIPSFNASNAVLISPQIIPLLLCRV
jgi:hypothetical protein